MIDENFTKILGRHQLQFGGRYRHERIGISPDQSAASQTTFSGNGTALLNPNTIASNSYTAQPFTGLAIADLYLGSASSYSTTLNHSYLHYRDQEIASYFQDDFHPSSRLVLNLGLRWEIHPALHEAHNYNTSFDLANHAVVLGKPLSYYYGIGGTTAAVVAAQQAVGVKFETAQQAGLPTGILQNNFFTFSPRLGAAYRPFGSRYGTVIRGGYGNYIYPPPVRNFYADSRSNAPFSQSYTQDYTNASDSPDGLANYIIRQPQFAVAGLNSTNLISTSNVAPGVYASGFSPNYPMTYVRQASLTVEQPMRPNAVLRVTYIHNHGSNLEQYQQYNTAPSNYVYFKNTGKPLGTGPTAAVAQNPYDNTTYGTVELQGKTGYSNNDSLQVNFQRLYKNGYAFQAYYTFSAAFRAGGNGWRDSNIYPMEDFLNGPKPFADVAGENHFLNYVRDTGIPQHRLRFNGIVDLPMGSGRAFFRKSNRLANEIIGGWQLAGDATMFSQYFGLNTSNWGTPTLPHVYKHGAPVQDCRSGVCYKAYEYFNGYIAANLVNNASKGVTGLPASYSPYETPLNVAAGTNTVNVTLANGSTVSNVTYSPGPGTHPFAKTYLLGPLNWTADLSLFKVFPIREAVNVRINADFFNVFNVQGHNNPDSTTGIESLRSSFNTARQIQLSARLTF